MDFFNVCGPARTIRLLRPEKVQGLGRAAITLLCACLLLGTCALRVALAAQEPQAFAEEMKTTAAIRARVEQAERNGDDMDLGLALHQLGLNLFESYHLTESLAAYERALDLHRKNSMRKEEANTLQRIGILYERMGHLDKALDYFAQSLALAKQRNDRNAVGLALMRQAWTLTLQEAYAQAKALNLEALSNFRQINNRLNEGYILNNLGSLHSRMGDYQEAFRYYEQSLAAYRDTKSYKDERATLTYIGWYYGRQGDMAKARDFYGQAAALARQKGDAKGEGASLQALGAMLGDIGLHREAMGVYEQTLRLRQDIGDRVGEGITLHAMATSCFNLGQYDAALRFYDQALAIRRVTEGERGEAIELNSLGMFNIQMGRPLQALPQLERSLALQVQIGNKYEQPWVLNNIGWAKQRLRDYPGALDCFTRAAALHKETANLWGLNTALRNLGFLHRDMGQYADSKRYFEQARDQARRLGDLLGEARALNGLGGTQLLSGDAAAAQGTLALAVQQLASLGAVPQLQGALRFLAKAEARLEMSRQALDHFEQSMALVEGMRGGLAEKTDQASFLASHTAVYDDAVTFLWTLHAKEPDLGHDRKAFEVYERKQGRAFLEEIGRSGVRNFAGLSADLLRREDELQGRIDVLQESLAAARNTKSHKPGGEALEALQKRLAQAREARDGLNREIAAKHPDYAALKNPKPVGLSELQSAVLKPGQAMLAYAVLGESTYLWAISKDKAAFLPLGIGRKALAAKVEAFRNLLHASYGTAPSQKRRMPEMLGLGATLYDLLVPAQARSIVSGATQVYVALSGPLYELPFEALVTVTGAAPSYFLAGHSVAYLSSASLLKLLRDAETRRSRADRLPLLALANPSYSSSGITEQASEVMQARLRSYRAIAGGEFEELPETEDEVRAINRLMSTPGREGRLLLRNEASRSNVLALNADGQLAKFQYVVFACHGILPGEVDQINQPALILSTPDPSTNGWGILTMSDVFGIKLNADMVTLSACNTGRGAETAGEGARGLTRAFMFAGTPSVTVNLWSVETQSATLLSTGMYQAISKGLEKNQALREAKLSLMRGDFGEVYQHPFFWSPMVMFGEGK